MDTANQQKQTKEEWINMENGNKLSIQIVNNLLKIQVFFNSKDYLAFFSLNYLKKEYEIFSYLSLVGIKDCINQRLLEKKFSISNESNNIKIKLSFNNNKIIELYIPFNEKIKEVSLENMIRLETEVINLNSRIKGIKQEIKEEIKQELKKEIIDEIHNEINEKENKLKININENIINQLENKKPKILYHQIYKYTSSILVEQKALTEVPYYTHEFKTEQIYQIVQVNINIPFTSIDTDGTRGRILTYLDNELICDSTISNNKAWELKPLTLIGYIQNLQKGTHKIKTLACVDKGTINLPHLNKDFIEYKIQPIISGSITIIGF